MPVSEILAATADDPAYQFGRIVGFLIVFIGCTLGILKCISIMKRPTTQSLCVVSLMLFLVVWILSALATLLDNLPQVESTLLPMLLRVLLFLILVASMIVAIVGLCLYDKNRHNQGRAQAVWALALFSLMMMIGVGAFVVASAKSKQALKVLNEGQAHGDLVKIEEFNLAIQAPEGWAQVRAEAINPDACYAIRRLRPEVYGMVLAEKLDIDKANMVEIAKSNLELNSKVLNHSQSEETVNGLEFTKINSRAMVEGVPMPLEYENWVFVKNGFVWQVVFWGGVSRDRLTREVRPIIESMKMIDPERRADAGEIVGEVERSPFGYRVGLEGLEWQAWVDEGEERDHGLYDLRLQRTAEIMMVAPIDFERESPPLHALRYGVLSSLNLENISPETIRIRDWDPGEGGKGQELALEEVIDGTTLQYKLRIARFDTTAYFIVGWVVERIGDMDLLTRSLDRVQWVAREGEAPSLDELALRELSSLYNDIGIAIFRQDQYAKAAQWFELSYQKQVDPVVLGNAADAYEEAQKPDLGLKLLNEHAAKHPDNLYVGMQHARLMVLGGQLDDARAKYEELLSKGLDDPDEFLAWLQLLNYHEHYDHAMASADAWVQRHPTRDARRWQAQTYSAAGEYDKALEIHEALHQEHPQDLKISCSLGEIYNEAGEHQKAKTLAESLLKQNGESVRALMVLGWSQMGLEWYRDAKQTFEKAKALEPDDEDIRDAIRRASALLGQGDNTDVKTPIEPVAMPAAVRAEMDKHAKAELPGGHPYTWLARASLYQFVEGQRSKRTHLRRVRIDTVEGAKNFSSVSCRFNPLHERIHLNKLQVINAEGEVISQAKPDDAYVRDEDDGTASDYKVLHVQIPGVRQGVEVEWEFTIEDKGTSDHFEFTRELFVGSQPTLTEAVVVSGEIAKIRSVLDQGEAIAQLSGKDWKAWVQGPRKPALVEYLSVPEELHYPMLWLGSAAHEWEKLGADYLGEIEEVLEADQSIAKLAGELCKEAKTDKQKVSAILDYIQKTVGYKAIAFGVRGTRPNAAEKTLELRYGDCKDMSVLMHQLLAAVGVKSNLALIDTEWMVEASVPSLDQFNHMVLHVPSLGENWLVDPTEKHLDQTRYPASGFWSNRALIMAPSKPRLVEMPKHAPAEGCRMSSDRVLEKLEEGWMVQETLKLSGYPGAWFRSAFAGMHPDKQLRNAQRILSYQGNAQVLEFAFPNLDDASQPAEVKLKYKVLGGISEAAGHQLGVVPALWEKDYLATKFMDQRETRFLLHYPYSFKSRVTVRLPEKAAAVDLDQWSRSRKSNYSEWSIKAQSEQNLVKVEMDFKSRAGEYEPDSYEAFHQAWEQPRIAWDKPLTWSVKQAGVADE